MKMSRDIKRNIQLLTIGASPPFPTHEAAPEPDEKPKPLWPRKFCKPFTPIPPRVDNGALEATAEADPLKQKMFNPFFHFPLVGNINPVAEYVIAFAVNVVVPPAPPPVVDVPAANWKKE
jgi:hypothetical protein